MTADLTTVLSVIWIFEIDRYARLIEAPRRLPPQIDRLQSDIVPDSLLYRNDSLFAAVCTSCHEYAGIGIALKDIINNFIYGIQLMGGRLRVGDWIESDRIRGRVVAVNYQCVQIETLEGTEMSFLNSSLFGKNFNNLTRNNSYEFTKIIVGVAYGTDTDRVRESLLMPCSSCVPKITFRFPMVVAMR